MRNKNVGNGIVLNSSNLTYRESANPSQSAMSNNYDVCLGFF